MTSLPLDVHEVLEQEYEAIYGLLRDKPAATYRLEDIVDLQWATRCLVVCKLEGEPLAVLNALVEDGAKIANLKDSPAMTDDGREIIALYDAGDLEAKPIVRRRIVDEAFCGAVRSLRDVRLSALYDKLHAKDDAEARAALCISGGGIRSATFALGFIQGLSRGGLLDKFHYLSTVSGGGYFGACPRPGPPRYPRASAAVKTAPVPPEPGAPGF